MESQICKNTPGRGTSPLIPDLEPRFRQNISPRGYECRMLAANCENAALCFQSVAHCSASLPSKIALCFVTLAHCSSSNSSEMIIMHRALGFFFTSLYQYQKPALATPRDAQRDSLLLLSPGVIPWRKPLSLWREILCT
jgi:hypothetical protein